jgi:two-component system, NtrC family, sensor kinase
LCACLRLLNHSITSKVQLMIKIFILIFLFAFTSLHCFAQTRQEIDSLKYQPLIWGNSLDEKSYLIDNLTHQLNISKDDTSRVLIMADFCNEYGNTIPDSAMIYGLGALALARQIKFSRGEARTLHSLGQLYRIRGEEPKSLDVLFKGLQIAESNQYPFELARCLNSIGVLYSEFEDYPRAISYLQQSEKIDEAIHNKALGIFPLTNIALSFLRNNQLDSSLIYAVKAYNKLKFLHPGDDQYPSVILSLEALFRIIGEIHFKLGNHSIAFEYLQKAIYICQINNYHRIGTFVCYTMAGFFKKLNQTDSCIYYAKKGLAEAQTINYKRGVSANSRLLAEQYESKDLKESLFYLKMADSANDSIYNAKKTMDLQRTISDEQERQRIVESQKIAYQNKVKQYALLAGLGVFLLIAFILYRNNQQKRKANALLIRQKEEINLQRDNAEKALASLKITQAQLIQSEKMASLGELTAGIAHEIQNPLNFVNNFSELNDELMTELKQAILSGNKNEALNYIDDIRQNGSKISHHGKRADAIVKGMLQHTREGRGQKEPTDINALAEEYLRLSYQGLRAKDETFYVKLQTDFDPGIGKVNIIPQDIGRVVLNLYNNAFYAVAEKKKQLGEAYEPMVTVTTKKSGSSVEISVKDNGNGIPGKLLDKIFQPFFTTKPAGQGTGLGLSMSYDIIKAHGGELKVETKDGEGTEFMVLIPSA